MLRPPPKAAPTSPDEAFSPQDIARKMKMDYLVARKEQTHKALEGIQSLVQQMAKQQWSLQGVLQEAASLIWRLFWIKEVTIGIRDPLNGIYKYQVMVGLREDIWLAHKRLEYRLEDFFETSTYRGTMISKYTKLLLAEENPYGEGEENTYNKSMMLESRRRAPEDSIEGDYFDIHIFGPNEELLGWVEISGTKTGKFPDATVIMWIETVGSVLGMALAAQAHGRLGWRH